jgi:hypothetical protein
VVKGLTAGEAVSPALLLVTDYSAEETINAIDNVDGDGVFAFRLSDARPERRCVSEGQSR